MQLLQCEALRRVLQIFDGGVRCNTDSLINAQATPAAAIAQISAHRALQRAAASLDSVL
jgi:hypothetical protein